MSTKRVVTHDHLKDAYEPEVVSILMDASEERLNAEEAARRLQELHEEAQKHSEEQNT